jgi:hypothetical protein
MEKRPRRARASVPRRGVNSQPGEYMTDEEAGRFMAAWANEQNQIAAHNHHVLIGELLDYGHRREMPRTTPIETLREERQRDVATGRPVRAGARRRADHQRKDAASTGAKMQDVARLLLGEHTGDYTRDGKVRKKKLRGGVRARLLLAGLKVSETTVRRHLTDEVLAALAKDFVQDH